MTKQKAPVPEDAWFAAPVRLAALHEKALAVGPDAFGKKLLARGFAEVEVATVLLAIVLATLREEVLAAGFEGEEAQVFLMRTFVRLYGASYFEQFPKVALRISRPGVLARRGAGAGKKRPKGTGSWHTYRLLDLALRWEAVIGQDMSNSHAARIIWNTFREHYRSLGVSSPDPIRQRLSAALDLLGLFQKEGLLIFGKQMIALLKETGDL